MLEDLNPKNEVVVPAGTPITDVPRIILNRADMFRYKNSLWCRDYLSPCQEEGYEEKKPFHRTFKSQDSSIRQDKACKGLASSQYF